MTHPHSSRAASAAHPTNVELAECDPAESHAAESHTAESHAADSVEECDLEELLELSESQRPPALPADGNRFPDDLSLAGPGTPFAAPIVGLPRRRPAEVRVSILAVACVASSLIGAAVTVLALGMSAPANRPLGARPTEWVRPPVEAGEAEAPITPSSMDRTVVSAPRRSAVEAPADASQRAEQQEPGAATPSSPRLVRTRTPSVRGHLTVTDPVAGEAAQLIAVSGTERVSLESLFDRALPEAGTSENANDDMSRPRAPRIPETPSRGAVSRALRAVAPQAEACGNGASGMVSTWVTIDGPSGTVKRVFVTGEHASTPVGTCVARTVRNAQFPRFTRSEFEVAFPFRVR